MRFTLVAVTVALAAVATMPAAQAQRTRCDLPREARDIWRCENGFVIGPENVIIRLPIPETDPEALYNAGLEAAQREDWRVAIAYFTAAHQRAHLEPRYMYNLGLAHARAGHEVAAIAWLSTFLLAEPNAPNRAAIWNQIAQLEAASQEETGLLWRRAQEGVGVLTALPGIDGDGVRAVAYRNLAESAATAGNLTLARDLIVHAVTEEMHGQQPPQDYLATGQAGVLRDAINGAARDLDGAAYEAFRGQLPANSNVSLSGPPNGDHLAVDVTWPLIWEPQVWSQLDLYGTSAASASGWQGDAIRNAANSAVDPPPYMGAQYQRPDLRLPALPVLQRGDEALPALQRLARWDWSQEPIDAELREDDASMAMMSESNVRIDHAYDEIRRLYYAEAAAALFGETSLIMGDTQAADAAARIARQILERARREAPSLNRDASFLSDYYYAFRIEDLIGYESARLDALLLAERGNIEAAVTSLTLFLSERPHVLSRYGAQIRIGDTYADALPGLAWSEGRHLATWVVARYLLRRGRGEQAYQLAERLDSLRRDRFYTIFQHGVTRPERPAVADGRTTEQRAALEDSIIVARTLGGAADDLPAWLAVAQRTSDPNQQLRLFAWAAEDTERGRRRVRAVYTRSGAAWGQ
jgi:hypothetical protein